jgi:hypothetical protein
MWTLMREFGKKLIYGVGFGAGMGIPFHFYKLRDEHNNKNNRPPRVPDKDSDGSAMTNSTYK